MRKHLKDLFPPLNPLLPEKVIELPMAWRRIPKSRNVELVGAVPSVILTDYASLKPTRLKIGTAPEQPINVRWTDSQIWTPSPELCGEVGVEGGKIAVYRRDGSGRLELPDGSRLKLGQLAARTAVWMDGRILAQLAPVWKDSDREDNIVARTYADADLSPGIAIPICALLILTQYDTSGEG